MSKNNCSIQNETNKFFSEFLKKNNGPRTKKNVPDPNFHNIPTL